MTTDARGGRYTADGGNVSDSRTGAVMAVACDAVSAALIADLLNDREDILEGRLSAESYPAVLMIRQKAHLQRIVYRDFATGDVPATVPLEDQRVEPQDAREVEPLPETVERLVARADSVRARTELGERGRRIL